MLTTTFYFSILFVGTLELSPPSIQKRSITARMLPFAKRVQEAYCEQMQSQKRAVMQRLQRADCNNGQDLNDLIENILQRSHVMYADGVEILTNVQGGATQTVEGAFIERFEALLAALLQDVVLFELMMTHWRSSVSPPCADTRRCYAHAALVMPSLTTGDVVGTFIRNCTSALSASGSVHFRGA